MIEIEQRLEEENTSSNNEGIQYIDLKGYTIKALLKTGRHCLFLFMDENYGEILITVRKDCIMYYDTLPDKTYHLKAVIRGEKYLKEDGNAIISNSLIIKRVAITGDREVREVL